MIRRMRMMMVCSMALTSFLGVGYGSQSRGATLDQNYYNPISSIVLFLSVPKGTPGVNLFFYFGNVAAGKLGNIYVL